MKLSKTSWLILSAGVFLVVVAGLGLTRSQQLSEQNRLNDELALSEKRLATLQTTDLTQQLEDLRAKIEEGQSQLKDAQANLKQTVASVDVTDEFFKTASYSGVVVSNLSTTTIAQTKYQGITCSTISITATVKGDKGKIINFVIALNNGYVTGSVQSTQLSFKDALDDEAVPAGEDSGTAGSTDDGSAGGIVENPESEDIDAGEEEDVIDEPPAVVSPPAGPNTASVSMIIYSYEGR
jgi:hypothetical protein